MFMPLRQAVPDVASTIVEEAKRACINAAMEISRICQSYRETYGYRLMNNVFMLITSDAIYTFLDDDVSQYHDEITNLCTCLRALSRRWPMAMAILRMVQHYAKQRKVSLPPETEKLFDEFENVDWRHGEVKRLISMYPSPTSVVASYTGTTKDEIVDMGKFLEEMERLQVKSEDSDRIPTNEAEQSESDDPARPHSTPAQQGE